MDASRRPQLPALSYLEVDKVKREDDAYQQRSTGTPQSLSASAGASPTYHCPPGPPPPYSHAHGASATNSWSAPVHTPPESRRTSEHEKETAKPRQSLPSISEALGNVDNPPSFATKTAPPAPLQTATLAHSQNRTPQSPSPRRSYPMEPPTTLAAGPYASATPFPHQSQHRSDPVRQSSYPPLDSAQSGTTSYPPVAETAPNHLQASHESGPPVPQSAVGQRKEESSPPYEQSHPARSSSAMGPPSSFSYGYTPFPARYADSIAPTTSSSGPIYQPSSTYGPPRPLQSGLKSGSSRFEDRGLAHHSNTVKRHLDFFDLEASLNEISSTSGILSDFSRRYGDRMHHTQRSGASLHTLPGLVEIDDMINKSRVAHDSLIKIRDVILQQQALFEQQAADQRQQHKLFDQRQTSSDVSHHDLDESKGGGGFAGVDTKKRRGRAAPPGRCHSCNRAETPEWRRGPDGARTLCNACGLHYAKLTRKNNGTNKNPSLGSSNLRPKENMP